MHELVKDYYGRQLQSSADLKTSACCDLSLVPGWLRPLLARIHPEVLARYYGCGLVCPPQLEGCRVLDLGCGSGRDVYALAQLVGARGEVVGVDMTEAQLAVAEGHRAFHAEAFGFDNVRFLQGYIESLEQLALEPGSFDVIVSNCVVNLSPDKDAVLAGVQRLLKPGGEFYFRMSTPTVGCRMRCATIPSCMANVWAARSTGMTFCILPGGRGSPTRVWSRIVRSPLPTRRSPRGWAMWGSIRPPTACSNSMLWKAPARTTGRR
jgi:SAM-dependent methyltransferase